MFKVIVVDDEPLIRKRIIYGFDWNDLGYEVCAEAENGVEAFEIIKSGTFDLAVIDICMLEMNGIELLKTIKKHKINIEIIFLTGHSEFKYAQEAVRYGVYEYVLKPLNEKEFVKVLKKLAKKLSEEKTRKNVIENVLRSRDFSDYCRMLSDEHLKQRCYGYLQEENFNSDGEYCMILFWNETFEREKKTVSEKIYSMERLSKHCNNYGKAFFFYHIYDDIIVGIWETEKNRSEELHQAIASFVAAEFTDRTICGYSKVNKGFDTLLEAYEQSKWAVVNSKIFQVPILNYEFGFELSEKNYQMQDVFVKDFSYAIRHNELGKCEEMLSFLIKEFESRKVEYSCVLRNMEKLHSEVISVERLSEKEMIRFMEGYRSVESVLKDAYQLEDVKKWFLRVLENVWNSKQWKIEHSQGRAIVEKASEYIRNNYDDIALSQQKIAQVVAVTTQYLSSSFKQNRGISMSKYITMVRMEAAQELIQTAELDINEIATSVGYNDEYYFSKCFKKHFGISPSKMRKISEQK